MYTYPLNKEIIKSWVLWDRNVSFSSSVLRTLIELLTWDSVHRGCRHTLVDSSLKHISWCKGVLGLRPPMTPCSQYLSGDDDIDMAAGTIGTVGTSATLMKNGSKVLNDELDMSQTRMAM